MLALAVGLPLSHKAAFYSLLGSDSYFLCISSYYLLGIMMANRKRPRSVERAASEPPQHSPGCSYQAPESSSSDTFSEEEFSFHSPKPGISPSATCTCDDHFHTGTRRATPDYRGRSRKIEGGGSRCMQNVPSRTCPPPPRKFFAFFIL